MKKFLIVLLCLFTVAGIAGSVYFGLQWKTERSEREVLVRQNGELQKSIDAIGPVTTAYTVKTRVKPGKEITEDDLDTQTIPASSISDVFILDKTKLIGKYYKVEINPGTSLTTDMIMDDESESTLYTRDIVFKALPIGLDVGDYIDINVVLPYGEEFTALEHKRVQRRVEQVITIHLTSEELAIYTSLESDMAKYSARGLRTYATMYVEPGVHDPGLPFYPVRKEMESIVTLNPNIKDKGRCINAGLRDEIETKLANVTEADGGLIGGNIGGFQSQLTAAEKLWIQQNTDDGYSSVDGPIYPGGNPTVGPPINGTDGTGGTGGVTGGNTAGSGGTDSSGNLSEIPGDLAGGIGSDIPIFGDEEVIQ